MEGRQPEDFELSYICNSHRQGLKCCRGGERNVMFVFSVHSRSKSVQRSSVWDMGKCEEPRAHPNGNIGRCRVPGVSLRRAAV